MPWPTEPDEKTKLEIAQAKAAGNAFELKTMFSQLVHAAIQARDIASAERTSYRDFHVGVAVLAFKPDGTHDVISGANYKGKKGDDPDKKCGEEAALVEAWNAGYRYIAALLVVGEPQLDEVTGKTHETLHPCEGCRQHKIGVLYEDVGAIDDKTKIITITPDMQHQDMMTPIELFASNLKEKYDVVGETAGN